jgi:hypothetical protein
MRFAKGFLRNFTIILVAYLGYLKWQNDEILLAVFLFVLAVIIGYVNYRLMQRDKRQRDDEHV